MKYNSFKYGDLFKKFNKKFVLTAVLAAVLSGPYIFQVSSKDFNMSEFASEAEVTKEGLAIMEAHTLKAIIAADKDKVGLKVIPAISDITDPTAKALALRVAEMRETLKKNEVNRAVQEANEAASKAVKDKADLVKKEKDDAEAAAKKVIDEAAAAEKKAKEEVAEKKKKDCDDKDKSATEKRDCKDQAKEDELKKKQEAAEEKFIEKYENAKQKCEDKVRSKDVSDTELRCKSEGFASALKAMGRTKDTEFTAKFVNEQFKDILGNELSTLLFAESGDDVEKANTILSSLFDGKIPAKYIGLKRMVIDDARRKANTEAQKVTAEFNKANRYAKNSTEYTVQYAIATAKQNEFGERLYSHGDAMNYSIRRAGDMDALRYYQATYLGNFEKINKSLLTASLGTAGGETGAAARNAATRNGLSTTTEARVGADGKMTRTGGVSYVLQSPETAEHISIGTPSSKRVDVIRHGIRQ